MSFAENITVEALEADPYPIYAELRRSAPVAFVPAVNLWFVTRWKDVESVAKSPDIFSAVVGSSPVERSFGKPTILTTDGETHKQLRQGVDPKYRPRTVAAYAGDLVRSIAEPFLGRIANQGSAELMADYFEPVSTLSMARSLGLADIDMPTLRRCSMALPKVPSISRTTRSGRRSPTRSVPRSATPSCRRWKGLSTRRMIQRCRICYMTACRRARRGQSIL